MLCDIPRHKVFISYFHNEDQVYKDLLISIKEFNYHSNTFQSIFDDYSVRENDIDDTGKSAEMIRKIIRDEYIGAASVLILLCGNKTYTRKYIDWELHAAMYDSNDNPKLGILVINLPTIQQGQIAGEFFEERVISPDVIWYQVNSRSAFETHCPFLPLRLLDNYESRITDESVIPVSIVNIITGIVAWRANSSTMAWS
ncbi:MAG: TIR domain-containing protein [Candidatus Izemoplasmatales bacterium]|nr:TIR domain-containing protein [Candidatus Izemoplasmatales bacterium]